MSASRPRLGVRHVTVVPSNYAPEDEDEDADDDRRTDGVRPSDF